MSVSVCECFFFFSSLSLFEYIKFYIGANVNKLKLILYFLSAFSTAGSLKLHPFEERKILLYVCHLRIQMFDSRLIYIHFILYDDGI